MRDADGKKLVADRELKNRPGDFRETKKNKVMKTSELNTENGVIEQESANALAEQWNLREITVTDGSNGYPKNLRTAYVGFRTFDDAKQFADMTGKQVCAFWRKYGCTLWESDGTAFEPFSVYDIYDGPSVEIVTNVEEYDEITSSYVEGLKGSISDEELESIKKEIAAARIEVESLGSAFVAILDGYKYMGIDTLTRMQYDDDSKVYVIGVE